MHERLCDANFLGVILVVFLITVRPYELYSYYLLFWGKANINKYLICGNLYQLGIAKNAKCYQKHDHAEKAVQRLPRKAGNTCSYR